MHTLTLTLGVSAGATGGTTEYESVGACAPFWAMGGGGGA